MNTCNYKHTPTYKITYKGSKGSKHTHEWLVCKICVEEKSCFGNNDDILRIVQVNETIVPDF